MRKTLLGIIMLVAVSSLQAQNFDDLHFGSDTTFEVMSWNIEWFPKNGQSTVNYVTQIIQALDVDVIALQEIDSKYYFNSMVDNLPGWEGYYVDDDYSGLAYIYKASTVDPYEIKEIYTENNREFPRAPSVMGMKFNGVDFVIINNHLKCCGDGFLNSNSSWDEETRRRDACILLEQFIKNNHPHDKVILLGDLNDILTDEPANNVFAPFMDQPNIYEFTDMAIAQGSSSGWSYPGWPSHLDHIMINSELFYIFWDENSEISTIKLDDYFDGGFNQYDEYVSDHRPVALKIAVPENIGISENLVSNHHLKVFPNPFHDETTLAVDTDLANVRIEVYNTLGMIIERFDPGNQSKSIKWNPSQLPPGIYTARLFAGNQILSVKKIIKRK